MLKDFNNLCGSCITMFLYATACTLGYKTGLCAWDEITSRLGK